MSLCSRYYCNYYPHVTDEKHRIVRETWLTSLSKLGMSQDSSLSSVTPVELTHYYHNITTGCQHTNLEEEQSLKEEGGMAFTEGLLDAKHLCMHFLI